MAGPSSELVLEPGQVLAKKYLLGRPAGFGGMAQLWVATNQATGAEVCIKLLVPDPDTGSHDEQAVERFRREAYAAAGLSHRAIVRVFDLLELDGRGDLVAKGQRPHAYAIVMELLHGETLGDMLAKRGTLPTEEALDLFLPIVSALGHAHRASVIHRDLKPDNIFLSVEPDGHVIPKVLDFGVSKLERASALTSEGVVMGTPCFMSPEQAKGSPRIDARSDVFSAGILLYMMLSGRNPFEDAPTFDATIDAILRRRVAPLPDLPPPIWSVIEQAIEKDPAKRFGDGTELGIALRKASGRRATTESEPRLSLVSRVSGLTPVAGRVSTPSQLTPSELGERPSSATPAAPPVSATMEAAAPPPREALVSAPSLALSSPDTLGDRQGSTTGEEVAARRRRTIVFVVVGAAALITIVALVISVLPKREEKPLAKDGDKVSQTSSANTLASGAASAGSTSSTAPSVVPPATAADAPTSAPADTARPTPAKSASGGQATSLPAAPRPPTKKKPDSSQIARDPGF